MSPLPTASPSAAPASASATPAPTPAAVSRALGVYVHNSSWDPSLLDAYAAQVGAMPALALSYHDWAPNADGGQLFPSAELSAFAARGITPLLTWEPWNWNASGAQSAYSLAAIAGGSFDAYIATWVAGARAYGRPIYIRLAHEMNGNWYPWGQGLNGNSPALFVAAWRHVVELFRSGGATNVRWVWSPNVTYGTDFPLTGLYPGDAYVDWVGLDGYNWGSVRIGWQSFSEIFGPAYDALGLIAPAKPVLIAETASTEAGGDKAAWIGSALGREIPTRFPRVRAVIWFDQDKETDWQVDSSTSSLAAFRAAATSPAWAARWP